MGEAAESAAAAYLQGRCLNLIEKLDGRSGGIGSSSLPTGEVLELDRHVQKYRVTTRGSGRILAECDRHAARRRHVFDLSGGYRLRQRAYRDVRTEGALAASGALGAHKRAALRGMKKN